MKTTLLFALLALILNINGQTEPGPNNIFTFEKNINLWTEGRANLSIDTVTNPNNIWQIGQPQKSVFTSAVSTPNVIVTDTMNSYPINDTSSFTIELTIDTIYSHEARLLAFEVSYNVNSDTLTDYGMIEYSPDNGSTWFDLLKDTIQSDTNVSSGNLLYPQLDVHLTGNSNGWKNLYFFIGRGGSLLTCLDTALLRFSFISDSIQNNKDGLMFDNIAIYNYITDIKTNEIPISRTYPNPTSGELNIDLENTYAQIDIKVLDMAGKQVMSDTRYNEPQLKLNLQNLTSGIYFVGLIADGKSSVLKIVKK